VPPANFAPPNSPCRPRRRLQSPGQVRPLVLVRHGKRVASRVTTSRPTAHLHMRRHPHRRPTRASAYPPAGGRAAAAPKAHQLLTYGTPLLGNASRQDVDVVLSSPGGHDYKHRHRDQWHLSPKRLDRCRRNLSASFCDYDHPSRVRIRPASGLFRRGKRIYT
jgi:hypothetical protein